MFILLTGEYPFLSKENILSNKLIFPESFQNLSEEAQAMLLALLSPDPNARPTAEEALSDPWFDCYLENIEELSDNTLISKEIFSNLLEYSKLNSLRCFAVNYIVSNIMDTSSFGNYSGMFQKLDNDGDGVLSGKEFSIAASKLYDKTEYISLASVRVL